MVGINNKPNYNLNDVKSASKSMSIEFRGRKTRLDILNLDYRLSDVALCLSQLTPDDYRKTIYYEDRIPDDEYISYFTRPGNEHFEPDKLYIKFCLLEDCLILELASFHLTRF